MIDGTLLFLVIGVSAAGLLAVIMLALCCRRRCNERSSNTVGVLPKTAMPHQPSFRTIDMLVRSLPELESIPETRVDMCASEWIEVPSSFLGEVSITRRYINDDLDDVPGTLAEEEEEEEVNISSTAAAVATAESVGAPDDYLRRQSVPAMPGGCSGKRLSSSSRTRVFAGSSSGGGGTSSSKPSIVGMNVHQEGFDFHALTLVRMTRSEAEAALASIGLDHAGAFLFRESARHNIVLSMCADGAVQHFNLNLKTQPGDSDDKVLAKLAIFVKHYRTATDGFLPAQLRTYAMLSNRRMTAS